MFCLVIIALSVVLMVETVFCLVIAFGGVVMVETLISVLFCYCIRCLNLAS